MFQLRTPYKYNGIGSQQPVPKEEGDVMSQLLKKIQFQNEVIKPLLGELTPLYRHDCIIYISGKYVGQGYGIYSDTDENYEKVGNLLKTI